jgi:hypothetical protein
LTNISSANLHSKKSSAMKKLFQPIFTFLALLPVFLFGQAPEGINYQTVIRDNQGVPAANTPVTLFFDIRDGSPAGVIVYSEKHITATNALGIVNLPIGQGIPSLGSFSTIDWSVNQKFLQISADINNTGNPLSVGTIQFMSVPYALFAKESGATDLSTDATLSGQGSNANPLKIAQQGATPGKVLKWNGTSWAPQDDNGEIYTEGNGIDITGNVITNLGDTNAANDITSDSLAGGDLSGKFSNLQIKLNAVTANEIANDAVGSSEIATGAVGSSDLATGAVTGDKIAQQGAAPGQVLKWNGTTWAPQNDNGEVYTEGSGIDITGNVITNLGDTNAANDITSDSLAGGDLSGKFSNLQIKLNAVTANEIATGAVGASELADDAVTGDKIAPQGATNGQVLQFNGANWAPATIPSDNWGAQVVKTDASLSGDGTMANLLKIAPQGATSGQVLKFDGATWKPQNDGFSGTLNGEVTGPLDNNVVVALKGRPIGGMGPQEGEIFVYDNALGVWKAAKLSGEITGDWDSTLLTSLKGRPIGGMGPQDGEIFVYDNVLGVWKAAKLSGDVTGGWNSTLLDKIKGIPITGTPAANQVLALNSANNAYIYADDGLKLPYNNVQSFGNVVMFNIDNTSANSLVGMQVTSTNESGIKGVTRKGQVNGYSLAALVNFNTNFPAGVFGESTVTGANAGIGVFGRANLANDDFGMGGFFQGKEFGTAGIGANAGTAGVFGFMGANQNAGVFGQIGSNGFAGVLGVGGNDQDSPNNTAAVFAVANGADQAGYFEGTGDENNGIFVVTNGADFGIRMEGGVSVPGGFPGNIGNGASMFSRENESTWATFAVGDCFCSGDPNFANTPFVQIDNPAHPEEQLLTHSMMESPEMKTVYDGAVTTNEQGLAEVELPDYAQALNEDFHYQLTVIGQFAQAIVKHKIKDNYFVIQTDKPYVEVNWQVTGARKPQFAKKDRPPVITEKPVEYKGKYYYPEFFGQPESKRALSTTLTNDMDLTRKPKTLKE